VPAEIKGLEYVRRPAGSGEEIVPLAFKGIEGVAFPDHLQLDVWGDGSRYFAWRVGSPGLLEIE
jgi:hypothetical protein